MKKLYKYIKQYSQEGNLINIFKSAKDAHHIIHRDSIISCCKGKYNIAGGYIWRFDEDPFEREIKSNSKKLDIICNICNSPQSVRSMCNHLKNIHNISTDNYVSNYGEFRPKFIKNKEKLEKSSFSCMECGEKLNSNQHLMYHITKKHVNITKSEYIIKYMYNDIPPTCKCGCGEPVVILENGNNCDLRKETYNRDYIKGHWDWEVFSNIGKQSQEEIDLIEFIKTIYSSKIETNVRNIIPKREIDIYLPDVNIGIEYNGLYWHSEKGGRLKDYHLNKFKVTQDKNIRLIQIFSDEWIIKKDIVKNKLKSILNNNQEKIYARKCNIQEIPHQTKNIFLDKYHIQGSDRSNVKLGLFYEKQLVAVMTFSHPRICVGGKKTIGVYELSRYATSINIIGGASKLLQFFIKNYNPTHIYSYSDNRWTDPNNNMYLKIGFNKTSTSQPGYFYTKNYTERIHRFNFNKGKLKKMGADTINKTEREIMNELGYTRIWDCGTTRYDIFIK